ncbi:MAG: SprB repeat-containing protein, partial [Bacteroidota bacterium]
TTLDGGQFVVTVTDANDCSRVDDVFLFVDDIVIEFGWDDPDCGQSNGVIETFVSGGTPPYNYLWSTADTTDRLDSVGAGIYILTVTSAEGCETVGEVVLTDNFDASIVQEGSFCTDNVVTLIAQPFAPGNTYTWSGPNGFTATEDEIEVSIPGVYSVTVTESSGNCVSYAEISVTADDAGFTLNGIEVDIQNGCEGPIVLYPQLAGINPNDLIHEWTFQGQVFQLTVPNLAVFETGLYSYTVTNPATGCSLSADIFVSTPLGCNGSLTGKLWADEGSCSLNGGEIPVPEWLVRIDAIGGNFATQTLSNTNGDWSVNVPPGDYTVTPIPFNNDLYYECDPPQSVTVPVSGDAYVDVFMPYVEECPTMYTSVVIPFLRRCFESEFYVWYCNDGPVVAEDAQLVLELDPFLNFIDASIFPSSIDAHTVTFDLGDLDPFECGFIRVTVLVSCDSELGQTHCVTATASPNDPCPATNDWNGANVSIDADCDGTNTVFTITNDGLETMTVPLEYIVIEDGIMMMDEPGTSSPLAPEETMTLPFAADGSTYYLQTNQEPGNPGIPMPTLVVEGCGTDENGDFTTGFVNTFSLGDNQTDWFDVACVENGGSYDPNAKVAYPTGYGERHYIEEGTKLTYDIYFQNTGTDTAFTVIIRDTLAPELDIESLRMGASTHQYRADLDTNRVLTITFDDIMLPDSNVDLSGSQGVVQFTIDHTEGLPLETEIRNSAAIYFDFNDPIITNETFHTLGDDFIISDVRDIVTLTGGMKVYPNPTKGFVNVLLD